MANSGSGASILNFPSLSTSELNPGDSQQAMFLKLDGVAGESKDSAFSGQIDVLSFGYKVSQSSSVHQGGGQGVAKANWQNFVITHYVDKASPNLAKYCGTGKIIPTATFSACKMGGGSSVAYLTITLSNCMVTEVHLVGTTNNPRAVEQVGLSYEKIKIEAKEQNADGSLAAAVVGGFNVKQNMEA